MAFFDDCCEICLFDYEDCDCPCKDCGGTRATCVCSSEESEESCICGDCMETCDECTCVEVGYCDCDDCIEYSETCYCDWCNEYHDHHRDHCNYCPCVDCTGNKQNECRDREHHDDCYCAFCCWYWKHAERLGTDKRRAESKWTRKQERREERAKRTRMEEI